MHDDSELTTPFCLFIFRFRSRPTDVDDNDRISLPSHMRAQISDPGCLFWKSFLVPCSMAREEIFSPLFRGGYYYPINVPTTTVLAVYHSDRLQYVSAGAESSVRSGLFSCRTKLTAPLICQFLCILTPHSLGSAFGRPRRLVTHVPSLPPA